MARNAPVSEANDDFCCVFCIIPIDPIKRNAKKQKMSHFALVPLPSFFFSVEKYAATIIRNVPTIFHTDSDSSQIMYPENAGSIIDEVMSKIVKDIGPQLSALSLKIPLSAVTAPNAIPNKTVKSDALKPEKILIATRIPAATE